MYANTPQDPRNPMPNRSDPVTPWAVDLFNIGPRNRLRLQLHFRYDQVNPETNKDRARANNDMLYNGIRTISIIRRFLLINAQGMRNEYTGIRVLIWTYNWTLGGTRPVEVLIECDDQYLERSDSIISRLQDRTFDVVGAPIRPSFNYSASEFPPTYVQPMPPPPPPPPPAPPERAYGDDEEDEANPSILGP